LLSLNDCQKISHFSKVVLKKAIDKGGSSIRDFKNISGNQGSFQKNFNVYQRENKKCLIYETRPHFCRVNEFSTAFKGYLISGDKFLIDCCKQHIASNYGYQSKEMKTFRIAVAGK